MGLATDDEFDSRVRCSRGHASNAVKSGALCSLRARGRSSAALAVAAALTIEQRIDAPDRLQGDRRDRCGILVAPCISGDVGQLKKLPPGLGPTECGRDSPT